MIYIARVFAFASILASSVSTAATAVSFSIPQTPAPSASFINGLDGFDFTASSDLSVSALGFYDHEGDGLLHDHPVGIFNTATEMLVGSSVAVTNASTLDASSNFRFEEVTPFRLTAGVTYTLTGYAEGPVFDPYIRNPNGIAFGPDVSFVRARSGASSGLQFPTTASQTGIIQSLYIGPNFRYTTVAEPSTAVLSLIGMALMLRRRSAKLERRRAPAA